MEFMNRSNQTQPVGAPAPGGVTPPGPRGHGRRAVGVFKGLKVASVTLLFSVTILIVVVAWYLALGKPKSENNYVEKDNYQAIFLNGGQVYFGKIKDLNDKYVRMTDIFYLRVNQVVQPDQENSSSQQQQQTQNDITIVKLGCELHRPENEMLINRDQVVFWENLKEEDGENTVPGAVKKYLAQYPNGQECQAATPQNNSTNGSNNNSTNNSNNSNSTTNINAAPNN